MIFLAFVLSNPARAADGECVERMTRDEVGAAFDRAEQSFLDLDDAAFRDRFNELAGIVLPCTGDLVPPDLAARYHRLMAIHLYGLGDRPSADAAIVAAKWSADTGPTGNDILPPNHDLAAAAAAATTPPKTRKVPEPRGGSIAFDGRQTRERPVGLPTLVQVFDPSGQPIATEYLGPRDPLPAYTAIPRLRDTLIGVGIGTGAGTVAALIGAFSSRDALYEAAADPSVPAAQLDSRRATTNLLSTLGGVGAVVTLGVGAGAVLVGPR